MEAMDGLALGVSAEIHRCDVIGDEAALLGRHVLV